MSMTYNTLTQQIQLWLNRNDAATIAAIPSFISMTEYTMAEKCDSIGLLMNVVGSFNFGTSTASVIDKPARWRRTVHFNYGVGSNNNTRVFLLERDYTYIRTSFPDDSVLGAPQFYTDYDFNHILVAPTPDLAYPFELRYLQLDEPISIINQTNWTTNNAPQVLFYGCMWQGFLFVQDFDKAAQFKQLFEEGMQYLNAQQQARLTDGTAQRSDV